MRSRRSAHGNGGNAYSYTSNVCARARAHARMINVERALHSVASVASADDCRANPGFETVAQTVASHRTVAIPADVPELTPTFPWTIAELIADIIRAQQKAPRQVPRHRLQILQDEICRLRGLLIGIFAEQNGWRHSKSWFTPSMLTRRGVSYSPWQSGPDWSAPFIDHSYCFRTPDRRAAAFATNPYGLNWTVDHPAIRAFCELYQLGVAIPRGFPTWWYPGRTTLIVFTPLGQASLNTGSATGPSRGPP